MSGTSVDGVANDVLEWNEVVLDSAALADRGRDPARRNGDEKRRRLFGSVLSTVVQERGTGVAFTIDADTDSSSRGASRECAESYITYRSAPRLLGVRTLTLTFQSL